MKLIKIMFLISLFMMLSCSSNKLMTVKHQSNRITFDMDLENGSMKVTADFVKSDVMGDSFLLNRDFVVHKIVCDGKEVHLDDEPEKLTITAWGDFDVYQYNLPPYTNTLHIEYSGVLTGETGLAYAKEQISPEFTILRWETFCYPIFAKIETLTVDLMNLVDYEVTVYVPNGYTAVTSLDKGMMKETSNRQSFTASGKLEMALLAVAISKFQILELESADYFLLKSTDKDLVIELADYIFSYADDYLSKHFGQVDAKNRLRVAEIPDRFGSFAVLNGNIFLAESFGFKTKRDMFQLIHEYIHTKWNVSITLIEDREVQRSRFFDEAFTRYFEYRVNASYFGEKEADFYINKVFKHTYGIDLSQLPSIKDWGKYELGNLSYSLGALCLYKLSELIGIENFDRITTSFLKEYREKSVNFELFCKWYEDESGNPDVKEFFRKWIYTDEYKNEL